MQTLEEEENKIINKKNFKIILASSSPRREIILQKLRLSYTAVRPDQVLEKNLKNPCKTVLANSILKAQFVYNNAIINNLNYKDSVIAGFDTIVCLKGKNIGKPADLIDAEKYLRELSGRVQRVITGVSLVDTETGSSVNGIEITKVRFRKLDISEIKSYLKIENVLDKAGAYDILGFGSVLIEKIDGCFYNVAGLPVFKFLQLLSKLSYKII